MRHAGILLHPTSLPGPYGMGDIGPAARDFLAWLEAAGQTVWQVLPLHPVDQGGSPYTSPSAMARNPLLLSIDDLVDDGWLRHEERPFLDGSPYKCDFQRIYAARWPALHLAAERVVGEADLDAFAATRPWVDDWALYAALVGEEDPLWTEWPEPLRDRDPDALDAARDRLHDRVQRQVALQWLFHQQWSRLRAHARRRGIALWGDMPYFVGAGSCDTWAHRELFRLDDRGRPTVITGVPPDAFSPWGQLWGHAHFDEEAHRDQAFRWWIERLRGELELTDRVRIDHFRGLESVWEVEADARDATGGRWIPGPGAPLLQALEEALGGLPLVAEDLGIITPEVEALRDDFGLPGMAVLHFAFGSDPIEPRHPYLPHSYRRNLVVFPGTHDNDTTVGWYRTADEHTRDHVRRYLTVDGRDIAWDLLRCAYHSVARWAIVPMQDVLSLDSDARMNVPGTATGNWSWRMGREAMNLVVARKLAAETFLAGRAPLR